MCPHQCKELCRNVGNCQELKEACEKIIELGYGYLGRGEELLFKSVDFSHISSKTNDIISFINEIDIANVDKMCVVLFNSDGTTECGYYNMNLKDKAQAKHELDIDIIDSIINVNKNRYFSMNDVCRHDHNK